MNVSERQGKISQASFLYIIYFLFILFVFLSGTQIFPSPASLAFKYLPYILCSFLAISLVAKGDGAFYKKNLVYFYLLFGFLLFSAISALYNFSLFSALTTFFGQALVLVLLIVLFFEGQLVWGGKRLLLPFIVSGILILSLAIMMAFFLDLQYYTEGKGVVQSYRAQSLFGLLFFSGPYRNPNQFGAFLMVFISSLILHYRTLSVHKKSNILFLLSLSFSIFFLIFTASRASYLGTFIFLGLYIFSILKNGYIRYFTLLFFGISAFVVLFFLINGGLDFSVSQRDIIWRDAFSRLGESPLVGVGAYQYSDGGAEISAHNAFVQKLASWGWFVFVFWFSFYFLFLFKSGCLIFSGNRMSLTVKTVSAAYIGVFAHQFFESALSIPMNSLSVYLCLLISFLARRKCERFPGLERRGYLHRSVVPGL